MPYVPPGFLSSQYLELPYPEKSFTGQTIIVVGADSGLGLEAARHLVRLDATKVILAGNDLTRGAAAAASIAQTTGRSGATEVWEIELCDHGSVQAFCRRATETLERLDVVLANAGMCVAGTQDFILAEGNEKTITVNVISTLLYSVLLLPKLRETSLRYNKSTVLAHTGSFIIWAAEFKERKENNILATLADKDYIVKGQASMADRYGVSKTMMFMAMREMAGKLSQSSKPGTVIISSTNPGLVETGIMRDVPLYVRCFMWVVLKILGRSAEVGSRTLVHAAEGGEETHGQYLSDCQLGEVAPWITSEEGVETQRRVWEELSARLQTIQPAMMATL